jgi:hypothetical protein
MLQRTFAVVLTEFRLMGRTTPQMWNCMTGSVRVTMLQASLWSNLIVNVGRLEQNDEGVRLIMTQEGGEQLHTGLTSETD